MCQSTTNPAETPRPCATCGAEILPDSPGCYDCAEAFGVGRATDEKPYATGYEGDEEYEQYWDQHGEG